jgi:hypothetical protein
MTPFVLMLSLDDVRSTHLDSERRLPSCDSPTLEVLLSSSHLSLSPNTPYGWKTPVEIERETIPRFVFASSSSNDASNATVDGTFNTWDETCSENCKVLPSSV